MSLVKDFYAGVVLASLLSVASCDRGAETPTATAGSGQTVTTNLPPVVSSPDEAETQVAQTEGGDRGGRSDPRREAAPVHADGAPIWSANSRNTAQENAERLFERNGKAFGAKTVDQYVDMAHAFIAEPPKGTLRLTRDNGDKLFYDPKGNVFAVATREGAPRTMFKPDNGMTYWKQQEQSIARRNSRGSGDDDRG